MAATAEQIANEALSVSKKNAESVGALTKEVKGLINAMKKTPAGTQPSQVFGAPWAIVGESPNTSRGFSFMKLLGVVKGCVQPEEAKVELQVHEKLHNLVGHGGKLTNMGYEYKGAGRVGATTFLAPLASNYFQEDVVDRSFRQEMKALVQAGAYGADFEEMQWIRRKQLQNQGYGQKTLSWLNELVGGALVAPPEMGELIELLRNKEALVNAGARTVPLPPQGRMKYPRQTAASTTYWVGENAPIPASDIGTGEVTLSAKKLAVLIKAPNELIRFASPAAEALLRDDMTKSLALGLDLAGLEGQGGDNRPLGIINQPNVAYITSSSQTANGDKLVGQDIYRFLAAVEEQNAEFETFVMRPKTLYKYLQLRSDAVAQGDAAGPFLFNLIREAGEGVKPKLAGHDVVTSTQVSQVRTKGNASNLTYVLGGMFSDCLIGMFGAIEFAATTLGDTPFQYDQTWVRGILSADVAIRHGASFVVMDNLSTTL